MKKFSVLTAFPTLLLPLAFYAVAAIMSGGGEGFVAGLGNVALSQPMPSGIAWRLSWADVFVLFGLAALFLDLLKASGTGAATVVNHALSMAVFVICLMLFLMVQAFASSAFFLITIMSLLDVVAGFTITIISARRDVSFER